MRGRLHLRTHPNDNRLPPVNAKHPILNPATSTLSFGAFPGFTVRESGRVFAPGQIQLRYGEHFGPHRGYGFTHIWREHFPGTNVEPDALAQVVQFVQSVLAKGSGVFYEGGTGRHERRAIVCRVGKMLVVLEEMTDAENNTLYSVVTAFRSNPKGVRVATL